MIAPRDDPPSALPHCSLIACSVMGRIRDFVFKLRHPRAKATKEASAALARQLLRFSWAHSSPLGLTNGFLAFLHLLQRLLQGYAPVRDPTEDFYMRRMYGRIVVSPR